MRRGGPLRKMRRTRQWILAIALIAVPRLGAQGPLVGLAPYQAPAFDSLSREQSRELMRYSDRAEYDSARADAGFELSKVRYRSDGLTVVAYLYRPTGAVTSARPAIIYNRGSYVSADLAASFLPVFRRLALGGFTVLAPQYRGSDGGEGRDEMGGADLADVLGMVSVAAALGGIDTTQLFLYGESRGGMMALQALREGMPIKAAATVGAFTDLDMMLRDDARAAATAGSIWPDLATRRDEIVSRRSAVRWAERIRAPLLILHGGRDGSVSPKHAIALAGRLQELGREYELHVIAGGSHTLGERSRERDARIIQWFRARLTAGRSRGTSIKPGG